MKEYYMRQCVLKKDNTEKVAWIPEKYAIANKFIVIIESLSIENWIVLSVGTNRKTYEEVYERSQDYKRTRKASDI